LFSYTLGFASVDLAYVVLNSVEKVVPDADGDRDQKIRVDREAARSLLLRFNDIGLEERITTPSALNVLGEIT